MEPKYYGAAAQYNKPGGMQFNRKFLVIGLGVILVITLLIVGVTVINGLNAGPGRDLAKLVARQSTLQTLLEKNKDIIRGGDLRKANADANLFLLSSTATLSGYMESLYGLKSIPTDISAAEADKSAIEDLKTAEHVGKFDSTFINIIRSKLSSVLDQTQKVLGEVGNQDLKTALEDTVTALESADSEFAKLAP
jgi:hypothetical protein